MKIRSILILAILPFIIISCTHIYFIEPQPKGGTRLHEFPKELHGYWRMDETEIKIDRYGFTGLTLRKDSVMNTIDTIVEKYPLSDTFRLYKANQYYVINYQENVTHWEIVVLVKHRNGDIYLYESRNPELFKRDPDLKLKEAHYTVDQRDTIVYTLIPNDEDLKFHSATFSGQMKIKTIKKIAQKENIITVLKQDGTMFSPESYD